ncbi:MAG: M20/M25/M40 family metallo-hydrolase [Burkholderiaceae bacterium]|nr:M20/M25/M40 family metallo-hydrolase [Burkholderiaceae bacterium]
MVGVIRGPRADAAGKSVGLRADMDALPMHEDNEFAHRSVKAGRMHACGHDGHTTMLLGAARYLAATRDFDGTVYAIFQPGEEGYAGAREMINDGLFTRFPADEVYAHAQLAGAAGRKDRAHARRGDGCGGPRRITMHGRGGHGAHPHLHGRSGR